LRLTLLERDEVVAGLTAELEGFRGVVADLSEAGWRTPTRCTGWTIADVTAHVTGVVADITTGRLDGAGTQAWYDRQVAERRGRPPGAVVEELAEVIPTLQGVAEQVLLPSWDAPAPPGIPGTVGLVTLSLWAGVYIHTEDVLAALARPPRQGPGLRAAVEYICEAWDAPRWGPVTVALDGMEEISVAGGGRRVTGDALVFVLSASGRSEPGLVGLDPSVNIYA
jgi:enediyne biosynthesis protein E11